MTPGPALRHEHVAGQPRLLFDAIAGAVLVGDDVRCAFDPEPDHAADSDRPNRCIRNDALDEVRFLGKLQRELARRPPRSRCRRMPEGSDRSPTPSRSAPTRADRRGTPRSAGLKSSGTDISKSTASAASSSEAGSPRFISPPATSAGSGSNRISIRPPRADLPRLSSRRREKEQRSHKDEDESGHRYPAMSGTHPGTRFQAPPEIQRLIRRLRPVDVAGQLDEGLIDGPIHRYLPS